MTSALVDQLGLVQAQISDLENQARRIQATLIAGGQQVYVGRLFRARVSKFVRETLPADCAKAKLRSLGVTPAWFRKHMKRSDVVSVRVVARSASEKFALVA